MTWRPARQIGKPGRTLTAKAWTITAHRLKAKPRLLRLPLLALGFAFLAAVVFGWLVPGHDFAAGSIFGFLLASGLSYLLWLMLAGDGSHTWRIGTLGEVWTADALRHLGPHWTVMNSLILPAGDGTDREIDHIAVGPGGVVVVDSKLWPAKTHRLDTKSSPDISAAAAKAHRQAAIVRLLLQPLAVPPGAISAAVMFWGADLVSPPEPITVARNGVHLVHGRDGDAWCAMLRVRTILEPDQVTAVVDTLRLQVVPPHRCRIHARPTPAAPQRVA